MPSIRIFEHKESIQSLRGNEQAFNQTCKFLYELIKKNQKDNCPQKTINVPNVLIQSMAELHADKWIEDVDLHTVLYGMGQKPDVSSGIITSKSDNILKIKSFSGDISGVIGETLFSIVIKRLYKIDDLCIGHFSHLKRLGVYPDFGIFTSTREFHDKIKSTFKKEEIEWPIADLLPQAVPCEVKTFSEIDSHTTDAIAKSISQIHGYYKDEANPKISIICLAVRNQDKKCYDINLIWGT